MDPRRLRDETRAEHEATEALLPLGHAGLTAQEYRSALLALLPVVASWESWAASCAPPEVQDMVRARRRADLLRADLRQLGCGGKTLPEPATINWDWVVGGAVGAPRASEADFHAGFLGAMYVMEGSTLGGRFLAKHVIAELGAEYEPMTLYFSGHGAKTGSMWREVTELLTGVPEDRAELTIEAARRCFGAFGEVLKAGLSTGAADIS